MQIQLNPKTTARQLLPVLQAAGLVIVYRPAPKREKAA